VGFAAEAILPHLAKGKLIAIDRSASAISRAINRNQKAITTAFLKADLLSFSDPDTKKSTRSFASTLTCFGQRNRSVRKQM
jgi:hypothetical protein